MAPSHPASRDKLPTVVQGMGDETAAGPVPDTVTKTDFIPTKLDHYTVLHKLGQGGMGWVMLAEDTQLGRRVALKVMRSQHALDEESRTRFVREARAAAALKHDNIITIYHVGQDQGVPYLAMELLEGGTLQQRLEYPKPLALGAAVRIGREIAQGLAAAHARGVVHRDIKPANIWLESPKGRVKILDFGLARQIDTKGVTQAGEIIGTPHYMAPEQARAKAVDARSDLFSLGCILYRMVTGRLPFAGDTLLATLTAIAVDMPPPVADLNPQAPEPLADLIFRLLAKDPERRPQTAAAVIDELRAIELELTAGKGAGSTAVAPIFQINTEAPEALPAPPKKSGLSGRFKPGKRPKASPLWIWIVAGALLAAVLIGLLYLITWALNVGTFDRPRTGKGSTASRRGADFRRVVSLDPQSATTSRSTAEWVLERGGSRAAVQVQVAGQPAAIVASRDLLPAEPFTLVGIKLAASPDLADADLARLAGHSGLGWLDLSDTRITSAGLTQLTDMAALTNLNLDGTQAGDDAVLHVSQTCPNLNRLSLGRTRCTPAVLATIARFKQMRNLSVGGLPLGDEHLGLLGDLSNLENLGLADTRISDGGLTTLDRLLRLVMLNLDRTGITDRGLAILASQGRLTSLSLNEVHGITGEGLAHLARLPRLESLQIRGARQITDAGLAELHAAKSLRRLEVNRGQFSAAAISQIQAALPQCEVPLREA
jgi:serine/threonine protein kinase